MNILHLNPKDPKVLAQLIRNGLIWSPAVPVEYKTLAMDALVEGKVELPDNLPPAVLDEVNKRRNAQGLPPAELPGTPGTGPQ